MDCGARQLAAQVFWWLMKLSPYVGTSEQVWTYSPADLLETRKNRIIQKKVALLVGRQAIGMMNKLQDVLAVWVCVCGCCEDATFVVPSLSFKGSHKEHILSGCSHMHFHMSRLM